MSTKKALEIHRNDTPDEILQKLRAALLADGDFPVRAKVVNELRSLTSSTHTPIEHITEVILRETTLATRVLHVVNSTMYRRAVPIMTVSQAIMQIGMRPLSELFTGLVLMQKFVPNAERGGIFADALKRSIMTSLLTSQLAKQNSEDAVTETGYLAGTFFSLGHLLMAYYFPQAFEMAGKRAEGRGLDVLQSLTEILGIEISAIRLCVIDALDIPPSYRTVIVEACKASVDRHCEPSEERLVDAVATADQLASAIMTKRSREELIAAVAQIASQSTFEEIQLAKILHSLPALFAEHVEMIELNTLTLPEYLQDFYVDESPARARSNEAASEISTFSGQADEIRQAIKNGEPISSIIASAMEAMAYALEFDRVILLMADKERVELQGRMGLGKRLNIDPRSLRRTIKNLRPDDPDVSAFKGGCPQIYGDPIFADGWPFAAIPIGTGGASLGVIYADKLSADNPDAEPLDSRAQASLTVLTDLLSQAVRANS